MKEEKEEKEENKEEIGRPPFFKEWKGLYLFVILFEIALIIAFILITNTFSA